MSVGKICKYYKGEAASDDGYDTSFRVKREKYAKTAGRYSKVANQNKRIE